VSVTWFNGEPKEIVVTITATNLTINKPGAQFFETANKVMLGYDEDNKTVIIRPLSKGDVLRGDIPEHKRYNISVNATYGRITNKAFINRLSSVFNLEFDEKGTKYKAYWNKSASVLEVRLKEAL